MSLKPATLDVVLTTHRVQRGVALLIKATRNLAAAEITQDGGIVARATDAVNEAVRLLIQDIHDQIAAATAETLS